MPPPPSLTGLQLLYLLSALAPHSSSSAFRDSSSLQAESSSYSLRAGSAPLLFVRISRQLVFVSSVYSSRASSSSKLASSALASCTSLLSVSRLS
ncbi:hypothetical protein C8J57DRAFT_1382645 [Mycena rebaudengoi]|nr:hypothetical protein C8J57DRAFT_1382645 [Mycena rebaudengoi]